VTSEAFDILWVSAPPASESAKVVIWTGGPTSSLVVYVWYFTFCSGKCYPKSRLASVVLHYCPRLVCRPL